MNEKADIQPWHDVLELWLPERRSTDVDAETHRNHWFWRMRGCADDEIIARFSDLIPTAAEADSQGSFNGPFDWPMGARRIRAMPAAVKLRTDYSAFDPRRLVAGFRHANQPHHCAGQGCAMSTQPREPGLRRTGPEQPQALRHHILANHQGNESDNEPSIKPAPYPHERLL